MRGSVLSRQGVILFLIVLQLSLILAFNYYWRVEDPFMDNRIALHNVVVNREASFEYRYRIMVPYAVDAVGRHLPWRVPVVSTDPLKAMPFSRTTFAWLYGCANFLAFLVMLWYTGRLVWKLFRFEFALFGVALSAVMIDLTFRDHYFHPWSLWEGAFTAVGLMLVYEKRYWLFAAMGVFCVVNRETSIFLLIGFFFYALPEPVSLENLRFAKLKENRLLQLAVGSMAAWTVAYFGMHAAIGYKPQLYSAQYAWEGNQRRWPYALALNALVFGPAWILVARGLRRSPFLIRRFAYMIPFYWGLLIYLAFWWEIRYWITLLPILVPALIASFDTGVDRGQAIPSHRA